MGFQAGDIVKITGNLSKTRREYGIDEEGEMKSMRGHTFPVRDSGGDWITLKGPQSGFNYTIHFTDVEQAKVKKVKPQVFEFDASLLDI